MTSRTTEEDDARGVKLPENGGGTRTGKEEGGFESERGRENGVYLQTSQYKQGFALNQVCLLWKAAKKEETP